MHSLKTILAKHPFFEDLGEPYLDLLAGCATNERYDAGEYLFREGAEATTFYIIREGLVAIETFIPARGPMTLYTHDKEDVIGWSWLFSPYHWYFSGRAVETTRVIALDGVCLRGKCEVDHSLGYEVMKRFAFKMMHALDATRLQLIDLYRSPDIPAPTLGR